MSHEGKNSPTGELSAERKSNREKVIAQAERFLSAYRQYDSDGQTELQAVEEMKGGDPGKVIELLEIHIDNCKSLAGDLLSGTLYSEPSDREESIRKQQEYLEMEELVRAIKIEYSVPMKFTPGLKRELAGRKKLKGIIENIVNDPAANDEN
jgi:hypothetical protein